MDFGLRRVGIAVSDVGGSLATPLRSLRLTSVREAPAAVAAVAAEVGVSAVVVGVPMGLEGEESRPEVRRVERFAKALRRESGLPVYLVDESLSTREAEERAPRGRRKVGDEALHSVAAAVILQRWLDGARDRAKQGSP